MANAAPAGFLAREAAISAVINAVISAGFFIAVFGLGGPVPVWGMGNFAFDFLPQSLAVTFFASFVPSLLAVRAMARGTLAGQDNFPSSPVLMVRSLVLGFAALVIGGAIWAALLWAAGVKEIGPVAALAIKVAYGFLLGATITYCTLLDLFSARGPAR